MNFGKIEITLLIAAVVLVLLVGGKKLPELARGIGQTAKEIRKGFGGDKEKDSKDNEK